jgi:hypothetical protein
VTRHLEAERSHLIREERSVGVDDLTGQDLVAGGEDLTAQAHDRAA